MGAMHDNSGNLSSMRKNVTTIIYTVCFVLFCVGLYILIRAIKGDGIDAGTWGAMGAFFTGSATIFGSVLFMQQKQKSSELKSEDNQKKLETVKKISEIEKIEDIG